MAAKRSFEQPEPDAKRPAPGGGDDALFASFLDTVGVAASSARPSATAAAAAAPGPSANGNATDGNANESDEDDPFEAFMAGVEKTVERQAAAAAVAAVSSTGQSTTTAAAAASGPTGTRMDVEADDEIVPMSARVRVGAQVDWSESADAAAYASRAALSMADADAFSDDEVDPTRKREVEALAPLNHATIQYQALNKDFYVEHAEITALSDQEVAEYRKANDIRVSGPEIPRPVKLFAHLALDEPLAKVIAAQGYKEPTAIQKQSLPVALSGRDLIGVAKTGSGKTASYVIPMIVHIMDQPELERGDGPIAVICAPTHELAHQIYGECKKFGKCYSLRVSALYGGRPKSETWKELRDGVEIVVSTPGRLIDQIRKKNTNMRRCSYLVLDEADRMFSMGFEPQVRSIVGQIRPDRQTVMFSATFKARLETLARECMVDPVRINVGWAADANQDIRQIVQVLPTEAEKWTWLSQRVAAFATQGSVLVFAGQRANTELLASKIAALGLTCAALHGEKMQHERNKIMYSFKGGALQVLVATDVAARGLDVPTIRNVICYDPPRDLDAHTHRIGRTGRAGAVGTAYTLLLPSESKPASDVVQSLESAGFEVPKQVLDIAMGNAHFAQHRQNLRGGKRGGRGGGGGRGRGRGAATGLGFKEQGDFFSSSTPSSSASSSAAGGRAGSSAGRAAPRTAGGMMFVKSTAGDLPVVKASITPSIAQQQQQRAQGRPE